MSPTLTEQVHELALRTGTDIEGLRRDLSAERESHRDCKAAQADSWKTWTAEVQAMKVELAVLKTKVALWAGLGSILGGAVVQIAIKLLVP